MTNGLVTLRNDPHQPSPWQTSGPDLSSPALQIGVILALTLLALLLWWRADRRRRRREAPTITLTPGRRP